MQIVAALAFLAVWLLVFWFGSIAFEATGMERRKARFQALSALTGTGFTTGEAELVVNYPRRRSIATWLIFLGNAGILSFLILLIAYVRSGVTMPSPVFIGIVVVSVIALLLSIRFGVVNALSSAILRITGGKRIPHPVAVEDTLYETGRYGIVRLGIGEQAEGTTIKGTGLAERGISVLAIERRGDVMSSPGVEEVLAAGDHLLCYGETREITTLDRRSGAA